MTTDQPTPYDILTGNPQPMTHTETAEDHVRLARKTLQEHFKPMGAAMHMRLAEAAYLAAIHDEQRLHTGLLTDLRGAIDDLAETLRPKGDPCPCGCRRDVESKPHVHFWKPQQNVTSRGYAMDPIEVCECGAARKADPESESVTVTLPRDVVERARDRLLTAARWATEDKHPFSAQGHLQAARALSGAIADALDAATTPPAPPAAHESDDQPTEAPADGEGAERPTAANLGRIGWLSLPEWGRSFLVREFEEGWTSASDDAPNEWFARENVPDAIFAPLTPADFGWTVLGDDEVVVRLTEPRQMWDVLERDLRVVAGHGRRAGYLVAPAHVVALADAIRAALDGGDDARD